MNTSTGPLDRKVVASTRRSTWSALKSFVTNKRFVKLAGLVVDWALVLIGGKLVSLVVS